MAIERSPQPIASRPRTLHRKAIQPRLPECRPSVRPELGGRVEPLLSKRPMQALGRAEDHLPSTKGDPLHHNEPERLSVFHRFALEGMN